MVIQDTISDLSGFATWIRSNYVPSIFSSVEFDSTNNVLSAFDADGYKVMEIKSTYLRVYRNTGGTSYIGATTSGFNASGNVIGCDNGFIAELSCVNSSTGDVATMPIAISKTNNDKVAVMFSSSPTTNRANNCKTFVHGAIGDSTTVATSTSFTPESSQQTVLTPFATNAKQGDVSYTPNAFYIPVCQSRAMGIGKFYLGYDTYVSNGYWAIKDNRSS